MDYCFNKSGYIYIPVCKGTIVLEDLILQFGPRFFKSGFLIDLDNQQKDFTAVTEQKSCAFLLISLITHVVSPFLFMF